MSDAFRDAGEWPKGDRFPKHEPEVEAARRSLDSGKAGDGFAVVIVKGLLALFLVGLLLGSLVAGFLVPIWGVKWLFGG